MGARARRQQLLLSTATLVGALTGYARGAYATPNCSATGPTVECTGGPFTDAEMIDNTGAPTESLAVTVTPAPFQVNTSDPIALTITGYGEVSFTDSFAASYLEANIAGLEIISNGDTTGGTITPGGVTVETHGTLTGSNAGIYARNYGSGVLNITANGNVTATGSYDTGIFAFDSTAGSGINVTTGANSTVDGDGVGIDARSYGNGPVDVTINGRITSDHGNGLYAKNFTDGTTLTVTTAKGSMINSKLAGMLLKHYGSGAMTITARGDSISSDGAGLQHTTTMARLSP